MENGDVPTINPEYPVMTRYFMTGETQFRFAVHSPLPPGQELERGADPVSSFEADVVRAARGSLILLRGRVAPVGTPTAGGA